MKHPKDVVIRLCRECGNQMHLESYEFDSDFRWYLFFCGMCNYNVSISESIVQDTREWRKDNGDSLEPLTKEEMEMQDYEKTPEGKKQTKQMFDSITKDLDAKAKRKKMLEAHDVSDDEKEELK